MYSSRFVRNKVLFYGIYPHYQEREPADLDVRREQPRWRLLQSTTSTLGACLLGLMEPHVLAWAPQRCTTVLDTCSKKMLPSSSFNWSVVVRRLNCNYYLVTDITPSRGLQVCTVSGGKGKLFIEKICSDRHSCLLFRYVLCFQTRFFIISLFKALVIATG